MTSVQNLSQPLLVPVVAAIAGAVWFFVGITYAPTTLCALWLLTMPIALYSLKLEYVLFKKAVAFVVTLLTVALTMQTASMEFDEMYATKQHDITLLGTVCSINKEQKKQKLTLKNIAISTSQKLEWISYAYVFCPADFAIQQNTVISVANLQLKKPTPELALYLKKERALGFFFTQANDISIKNTAKPSWIDERKEKLQRLIEASFSKKTAEIIQSIFLGQSSRLSPYARNLFERWGISHYLARSGLHLVMLVFLITLLLNALTLPMLATRILTLAVVILYHTLTMPSISFLRALFMNFAFAGAFLTGTQPNTLHIFLTVTLITLLFNPFVVFYADFQLSFGITGALILVFNKMQRFSA